MTMRRDARRGIWLAAVAGLMLSAATAYAQTPVQTPRKVSFGVLGGVTVGSLDLPLDLLPTEFLDPSLSISIGQSKRVAFAGGFFVATPLANRAAFETGALISAKGTGLDVTLAGLGSASGALQLTYLDVPALARLEVVRGSRGRFFVLLGPEINVNLDSRASFSEGGQSASEPLDGFPRTDYSVVAAGRVERGRALFELRYEHGLRNLADDSAGVTVKNRTTSVLGGWRF
jgi:hypothetical protein